MKFSR
jgi:hypothetical protein